MDEKITKLYQNLKNEGVDDIRANDIIQKVKEYYEYLSNYNLEQLDYIGALKAIQYGRFLKSNNAGGDNAKVWNDTKVYSDNDVVIWKPRNYQESSIIGSPQWCISFRDYHWNDHVIHNGETIYMIYNGWANEDLQYTSACVERNGNIIIYDSNHNKLNDIDKESYLKSLGDGISVLKPQINVENKQYNTNRNMNKLIRLTESDLHRIVKESVQRILKETRLDYDEDNFSGRYSRNADNTIPYQGKLFAFDVDDRGKIYKYGQQPIDVISQCESEAERYGQGHCSVETYESEEDYINAIRNYIKKGYVVTN